MFSTGEYCPIAVGVECLGDRWTPLVLRELLSGSCRFNDIHRGIPRISRTLLSQRLRALVERGLVERTDEDGVVEYHLTEAGADLQPIIMGIGLWAARWAFGDPTRERLDIAWLVWKMRSYLDPDRLPARRTTVEFQATGHRPGRAWLVVDRGGSTACQIDPGFEVDLLVTGDNAAIHRWFLGRTSLTAELDRGSLSLTGPVRLQRAFPTWFVHDPLFAEVRRAARAQRAGTESLIVGPG